MLALALYAMYELPAILYAGILQIPRQCVLVPLQEAASFYAKFGFVPAPGKLAVLHNVHAPDVLRRVMDLANRYWVRGPDKPPIFPVHTGPDRSPACPGGACRPPVISLGHLREFADALSASDTLPPLPPP